MPGTLTARPSPATAASYGSMKKAPPAVLAATIRVPSGLGAIGAAGAAVAYQPSIDGRPAATATMTVSFLKPARLGDRLRAVGERKSSGRRVVTCDAQITNQDGELVATALVTLAVRPARKP